MMATEARSSYDELVQFCEQQVDYQNKGSWDGLHRGEQFSIRLVDRNQLLAIRNSVPESEQRDGNLVQHCPALSLTIDGRTAYLTWGEAVEIIDALTAVTGIGMFG